MYSTLGNNNKPLRIPHTDGASSVGLCDISSESETILSCNEQLAISLQRSE